MDVVDHNKLAWNQMFSDEIIWSHPVAPEVIEWARAGDWNVTLTPKKMSPTQLIARKYVEVINKELVMFRILANIFCGVIIVTGAVFSSLATASEGKILNFLFLGAADPSTFATKIDENIDGVQIVYNWKILEEKKDLYNFEKIERDISYLESKNKKLWVQLQDRFFEEKDRSIPSYLQVEKIYDGGLARQKDNPGEGLKVGRGWVTKQWNPEVRGRYQKLVKAIATRFDGRIYGINLPETSADIDIKLESKTGFTCDKYFQASLENINFTKEVFKKSNVVQYINFWPCEWDNDHNYMGRFFQNASTKRIGLGGPDIIPNRKGQMKNSYPFFNSYKGRLPIVAFAVQEPTRTYTNPSTGKKYTDQEFLDFGSKFLGTDIIFWSIK